MINIISEKIPTILYTSILIIGLVGTEKSILVIGLKGFGYTFTISKSSGIISNEISL